MTMPREDTRQVSRSSSELRAIERVLAAVALIPAAVPLLFTWLLISVFIGRPVLYRQKRVGLRGIPFTILKFRTMTESVDPSGKLLPDAQRTGFVGRFLRRVRIDELPQLVSIVRGDMAFIGPRPLQPTTIREMGALGLHRCKVRPGLTGWSQVNGNTLLSDGQKLALDIWYVYHQSLRLNLLIVWKTFGTLLWGEHIDIRRLATAEAYLRNLATAET